MELSEQDIHPDIQQINKTNSLLNNLEAKLNQYMSKSRIVTQRVPTAMTFLMPNIDFKASDRSQEMSEPKSQNNDSKNNISNNSPTKNVIIKPKQLTASHNKNLNLIEEDIRLYQDKIAGNGRRSKSKDRFEELYQQKAKRLDQEIEELSQRKYKIKSDREILGKQNRRLVEVLKEKQKQLLRLTENQKKEQHKKQLEKNQTLQLKRKNILISLQKQKLLGEQLDRERKDLQYDIKLLEQKSLTLDYQTRKTSREKSKSKSKIFKKKSASSTSKNYPSYSTAALKNVIVLKTSKSKSTLSKKYK